MDAAIGTLDVDGATTVWVTAGLSTHDFVWERNDGCVVVDDGAASAIAYNSLCQLPRGVMIQNLPPAPL